MSWRNTGLLLLAALGLGAFVYFYELEGETARLEAEESTKRLFPGVEAAEVGWIALRTSDGADARFEQRDGSWRLVQPVDHPADSAVERMAESLAGIVREAEFAEPQPDVEYGLDASSARIVRFGVGDTQHELRFGRETPVGSNVYAKTDASDSVYTVAGHRSKAFERSLTDLRDKSILAFDPSTVVRLDARWPGGRVVLEREPAAGSEPENEFQESDAWRMTGPVETRGDVDAIDRLLSTLSYLRADGFLDAPSEADAALLEPPDFAVTLHAAEGGADPIVLRIGRPNAAEERPVATSRSSGKGSFWIRADRLADFPRETVAYRDRSVSRFAEEEAAQLDFFFQSRDGDRAAIHAARDAAGEWSSSPEAFTEGTLARLVGELARLDAEGILAESMGEAELAGVGLSPPNAIVTVLGATPAADAAGEGIASEGNTSEGNALPSQAPVLAEVHFGAVSADGVIARAAGNPIVYRLAIEQAEHLPVSLAAFRNRFRAEPADPDAAPPDPDSRADLLEPTEESP